MQYLCTEKAFAGPGIRKMYEFFNRHRELSEEEKDELRFTNEFILQKGIKNEEPTCRKVLDFFIDMYASEVGNMILRDKSMSGIYLVGKLLFFKISFCFLYPKFECKFFYFHRFFD